MSPIRGGGDFHPYVGDPSVCRSPEIAAFHDYWRARCTGDRLPSREAIDPAELKSLLPHLLIVDIEQTPLRIRYRLVGTAIVSSSRRDITGHYLDELRFDHPDERATFEAGYRLLLETRGPVFGRVVWPARSDFVLTYESGIFPLAADGRTIDKAVGVECYLDSSPGEIGERVPQRPVRGEPPGGT